MIKQEVKNLISKEEVKRNLERSLSDREYSNIDFISISDIETFEDRKTKMNNKAGEFALRSGKKQNFRLEVKNMKCTFDIFDFEYSIDVIEFNDIYGKETEIKVHIIG